MNEKTVRERLEAYTSSLTRSEKQLAQVVLQNYPVTGLGTITTLAAAAGVSTPTVARLVQKLGFSGFAQFQQALRDELDQKISSPLTKRQNWSENAPDDHLINRFSRAAVNNIGQTLAGVDFDAFQKASTLLSDSQRRVFVVGGRITRTLADYFFLHFQVIRDGIVQIPSNTNAWPHYLLDMQEGDVLVVFDIRRYENATLALAEAAHSQGANIILMTDQWASPVAQYADVTLKSYIAVPSSWDSGLALLLLSEILIAEVEERNGDWSKSRIAELEVMFDQTKFFRKF